MKQLLFRRHPSPAVLAVLLLFGVPAARAGEPGDVWHQWRGPARDGQVRSAEWADTLHGLARQWRVPLGKGFSGPIVGTHRVFVVGSGTSGAVTVRALDRQDGQERWSRSWSAPVKVPFFAASHGSWVRSTPVFDGETLFVGDMKEVLVALDGETGEERWRLDLPAHFGVTRPSFGFASSPLIVDDHLYVQAANGLVKIHKESGRVVWRTAHTGDGMMSGGAFSSPILSELHGVRQLVVFTRAALLGVDPATGNILWSQAVPNFRGMNIVTPVVNGDDIFVSQHRNGSYLYRIHAASGGERPSALRVEAGWQSKGSGYMSSPVVIDGFAYLHLGNGRFTCLDLASGEERWRTGPMGDYWSLVWQGDRILALSDDGVLRLIQADPSRFRLLDQAQVADSSTWGHLAVAGSQVIVRELGAVSAFRLPAAAEGRLAAARASR